MSYERTRDWHDLDRRAQVAQRMARAGIQWHPLRYHKRPALAATAWDVARGIALCRRLVREGDSVTVLARPNANRWRLADLENRISIAEADIGNLEEVRALVEKVEPDVVFHLACSIFNPPVLTATEHLDVNVRGTLCLLEALKDRADCAFIYTASAAEYPPKYSPRGVLTGAVNQRSPVPPSRTPNETPFRDIAVTRLLFAPIVWPASAIALQAAIATFKKN